MRSQWWEEAKEGCFRQKELTTPEHQGKQNKIKQKSWRIWGTERKLDGWLSDEKNQLFELCSPKVNLSFLSDWFQDFFLSLVFSDLIMIRMGIDLLRFILSEVLEPVGLHLLSNLGIFSHYSFKYIYIYPCTLSSLLLSLWHKWYFPTDP